MKIPIRFAQAARIGVCLALLNIAVPGGALVTFGVPARQKVEETLAQQKAREKDLNQRRNKSASRLLTSKEKASLQGRAGENPYLAGTSKWDALYQGVNLMTGNYTANATDITFDGGYGIPVNITRAYSTNNIDEGPFGKGWTLSADVRSTAGGLLKSGSAPVRTVPVTFKERPAAESDPNAEVANGTYQLQPVEAVIATDAGGDQETVQKDIDGVLTTPPWDTNVNENTQYEFIVQSGQTYQVMTHNETVTNEGTRYVYDKKGTYLNGGAKPWNDTTATAQPTNVTKLLSATDRQGNVTTYTYGSGTFDYVKSNGTTRENPLTSIAMPGGHQITLTWGTSGAATGRVTSVSDGIGGRTVNYTYSGTAGHGLLASATSPGGKTTTYGYGSANNFYSNPGPVADNLLTSVTDPRGLTLQILYDTTYSIVLPYRTTVLVPCVVKLVESNGLIEWFRYPASQTAPGHPLPEPNDFWQDTEVATTTPSNQLLQVMWAIGNSNRSHSGIPNAINVTLEFLPDFYTKRSPGPSSILRTYDVPSQNLIHQETGYIGSFGYGSVLTRSMPGTAFRAAKTITDTTYNFMGAPLSVSTTENLYNSSGGFDTRAISAAYAYWGADKYYQQKATRDQAGRYSYIDYYPKTAAAGKRGQTYRVYDAKNGGIYLDTGATVPVQVPPVPAANVWRYQITVPANNYSAQFDYDPQGRTTDVWKLQKTTTSPWTYTQNRTSFGADGAPTWGQANQIVEDFGGIARTTQTLAYTSWGKATDVLDAAGHRFVSTFDADGRIQSVVRTDVSPNVTLAAYTYGTSGVSNGQPTSVSDGLSGVSETLTYASTGAGIGQPSGVTETNGGVSYSTTYTYNTAGDRQTSTYTTPNGTTRWGYYDYVGVGDPTSAKRVFQTAARLDSSGNRTAEEFHYVYDSSGRLLDAAFAQTPYIDGSGNTFVPLTTGAPYYDTSHPASTRARTHYVYDSGGRTISVATYWDTLSGGTYTSQAVLANECDYEVTGSLNRGLKTTNRYYVKNAAAPSTFSLERTETYGYDASLDSLTSANYGDGNPNATPTWSYDPAGNRNDASVVDNLNRVTTQGGAAVTNDILGNRLTKSSTTYGWDALNRLTSLSGSVTASYQYRSDGIRVAKTTGGVTTLYRYDGQMGIEDVETPTSGTPTVTRYGLGARGVELIERTQGSTVTTGFPIYDAYGNNVGTLSRGTGGTWSVGDRRSYDAWGIVRAQQSAGDPKLRYAATLGHKQDDESGLIYMRARYYDPASGRFVSEDPSRKGRNWFAYAANMPTMAGDFNGKDPIFGPIDMLIRVDNILALIRSGAAARRFADVVLTAESSLDIENGWGVFMSNWNQSLLAKALGGGDAADALLAAYGIVSAASSGFNPLGTLESGFFAGAELTILAVAYNARMQWYIDDIDNF